MWNHPAIPAARFLDALDLPQAGSKSTRSKHSLRSWVESGRSLMADEPKSALANPAPLGLIGFGLTTVILSLINAGVLPKGGEPVVLPLAFAFGGLIQMLAGVMEFRTGNTFGTTAFISYGMFWLTLVALIYLPQILPGVPKADGPGLAAFLGLWGVFTFGLFFGTLRLSRALQVVFLSLTILFVLLAIHAATGADAIGHLAGYEGLFCGASAFYAGLAQVLNELYGKEVLPLGAVSRS